jgi:hypothetical protein
VAQSQPQPSEFDSTVGGSAPIPSLAEAPSSGAPPGAVWLTMCAWCARTKVGNRWIEAPQSLELIDSWGSHEPSVSHGICPSCFDEATAKADRDRRARDES